jgi:hypothetical protein
MSPLFGRGPRRIPKRGRVRALQNAGAVMREVGGARPALKHLSVPRLTKRGGCSVILANMSILPLSY